MLRKIAASLTVIFATIILGACGTTSTPDLKLIMILYCGDSNKACSVEEDKECEGRGRFNDIREDADVMINDMGGKRISRQEIRPGTYDAIGNTCTFSETFDMKTAGRYEIIVGNHGPFYITKSDLEKQNWAAVLEFNN